MLVSNIAAIQNAKQIIFFITCLSCFTAFAETAVSTSTNAADAAEPPEIGNFSLPASQQPGSFLSFGQNILDQDSTILYFGATQIGGQDQHTLDLYPSIVYGITDNFSINVTVPYAASYRQEEDYSNGVEDTYVQFEYAFYQKSTHDFSDQATVVINASLPTGSETEQPSTGYGSPSVFLGYTFSRLYVEWFGFISDGTTQTTTSNENNKFGSQYYYQLGLGRNIYSIPNKLITAWLIEFNGIYSEKDRLDGLLDPDSGGNVAYIVPSIWISTQHLTLQLGGGKPIFQHLNGDQKKDHYLLAANLGWTFH